MLFRKFVLPTIVATAMPAYLRAQSIPSDKKPPAGEEYICEGQLQIDGRNQAVQMHVRQVNPGQYIFQIGNDIMKDTPYNLDSKSRWPYTSTALLRGFTVNGGTLNDDPADFATTYEGVAVKDIRGWNVKENKPGLLKDDIDIFNAAMKLPCKQ